jgi:hypothetical protein
MIHTFSAHKNYPFMLIIFDIHSNMISLPLFFAFTIDTYLCKCSVCFLTKMRRGRERQDVLAPTSICTYYEKCNFNIL